MGKRKRKITLGRDITRFRRVKISEDVGEKGGGGSRGSNIQAKTKNRRGKQRIRKKGLAARSPKGAGEEGDDVGGK